MKNKKLLSDYNLINKYKYLLQNGGNEKFYTITKGNILYYGTVSKDVLKIPDKIFLYPNIEMARKSITSSNESHKFIHVYEIDDNIDNLLIITSQNVRDNTIKIILNNDINDTGKYIYDKDLNGIAICRNNKPIKFILTNIEKIKYLYTIISK